MSTPLQVPARLTEGPLTRALVKLAWPVFVSRALHTLYGVVDTIWVGRLGPEAIAAVSTSFFASWIMYAFGDILIAGATALVAQAVGARRDREASIAASTACILAVVLGVFVMIVGWFSAPALFRLLLDDPKIVRLGSDYLSWICLLGPFIYVSMTAESVYRACGDSRTPMLVMLLGTLMNIVLDPLLILGIGPFPALGVRGAAFATLASEITVLLVFVELYRRRRFPLELSFRDRKKSFSKTRARQIIQIGAPHAAIGILFSVVYLFLTRITGYFGAAALAGLGVVNRIEAITYLTATAVGMGVSTLVGQNVGADQPDRAAASAHRGAALMSIPAGLFTIAFLLFPEAIITPFTNDPEAIAHGVLFLRIVAVSQLFMAWELVYGHAFTGAGDTMPPMIVSVSMSVIRIPLAWWLAVSLGLGPISIWWTISITAILRGLILSVWFFGGRWRRVDWRIREDSPHTQES